MSGHLLRFGLATLLTMLSVNAWAGTVSGKVRFFDERTWRSDDYGSRVLASTSGTNEIVRKPVLYFYRYYGACRDFEPTCGEVNDQYLGQVTGGVNGYYSTTVLPPYSVVYALSDFRIRDPYDVSEYARVFTQSGQSIVAISNTRYIGPGSTTWDFNLSCPKVNSGLCTSTDVALVENVQLHQAANILGTVGLVDQYAGGLWDMNE